MSILLMLISILILLAIYLRFFHGRRNGYRQFVKFILLPLTIIGGWVIYFIGYHLGSTEESSLASIIAHALQAVFSAGRLFVLGNDLVEVPETMKHNFSYLLWFSFVGTMAVFLSISILVHVFGKRMITRIRILLSKSKEHHVFFGVNQASISLARDLICKDKSRLVIFIKKLDKDENEALYHEMEETGAVIINSESFSESMTLKREEEILHVKKVESSPENLRKFKLMRKVTASPSHLYFLSDSEEWNMGTARSVLSEARDMKIRHPLTLHIHINGPDLEEVFYESLPAPDPNIRIKLINYSEVAVRQLIARHNPVDWISKDSSKSVATQDFNVMIIGFGQTGSAALLKLIEYGQFVGSRFSAMVVDKEMAVRKGRFENRFPGISGNYQIEYHGMSAGCNEFFRLVQESWMTLDFIVISLGDDALNVQTAVDLREIFLKAEGRVKVIVQVKNNDNYVNLFNPEDDISINIFGRVGEIFTEDIVVRGKLEAMAVRIHDYYASKKPASKAKSWDALTRMEQASNISAAEHIYIKLALAGISLEEVKASNSLEEFERLLGPERLENLAKGEHMHWNAILFTHGWNRWDLKDIPADARKNKDNVRKLHSCLVEWDELAAVGQRFGEDYFSYDYDSVRNICHLVREGIYFRTN